MEETDKLHELIEQSFKSNDRQFIKMAQRLCHHYRISYYVFPHFIESSSKILVFCKYSLFEWHISPNYKRFHINLSK